MKIFNYAIATLSVLLAAACDDINDVERPDATVTVDKTSLNIHESMTITIGGSYDQAVVWTGDENHNYDKRFDPKYDESGLPLNSNWGLVVNKGIFTYSYANPGEYNVLVILTNSNEKAEKVEQVMQSFAVTVTDPYNKLKSVSAGRKPYYDISGVQVGENDWFIPMPRKFRYNKRDMPISLTSHNITLTAESSAAAVTVGGKPYDAAARYNLTTPLDVKVISGAGMEHDYKVTTMFCPEFTSYTLAGAKGTITRSDFDYTSFTVEVTVPSGTDITSLVPEFALTDKNADHVYLDGVEQLSGESAVDFSTPVVYELRAVNADNPAMVAVSHAEIIVKTGI